MTTRDIIVIAIFVSGGLVALALKENVAAASMISLAGGFASPRQRQREDRDERTPKP